MKKYNLTNNTIGWLTFIISAIVYLLTIEPTASFWDCPEFIITAYKLEVGHPPGSPIFMLTANFFTHFASDPSHVAKMVNTMSALCSAFTILFLFWSITHLTRKLVVAKDGEPTLGQTIIIMGSGLVGALAYTFSDTFWFSAVEGEVYAYSSLCTAVVFWMILKWENVADKPHSDRWIVAIAYVMGLSIGVHLLNLLTIPALVLVYYYKKYPDADAKGSLKALLLSFGLLVVLMYGLIPGFFTVAGWFELLFVNVLKMPFNTGAIFYFILVVGVLIWSILETLAENVNMKRARISFAACVILMGIPLFGGPVLGFLVSVGLVIFLFYKKNLSIRVLNTCLLCLMVILIGYSSYALIVIRSSANPPMDQNSPEDVFALTYYLNREQYGDRPLFYGQTYASDPKYDESGKAVTKEGKANWIRKEKDSPGEKDSYVNAGYRFTYEYENQMLFPRMYSSTEKSHIAGYKYWAGIDDKIIGGKRTTPPPTFMQNLRFFFSYQLNFMYWRYFMWNFSGRQNDIQGNGEITHGNWITGINFIDNYFLGLGDQSNLPPEMASNKGHNAYFMLPLILGIIGLFYQAFSGQKGIQGFWITFFLFFMTGIAIVLYLNQTPYQPRERDYAYAGSFYAFCIWIGMGVAALARFFEKYMSRTPAGILATVITILIPIRMGAQNWNDHDRSNRYTTRDFGFNYLDSCEPDAVIFTNGDNDTFPLWYAQEVEGYRTDVRVCNLSYLQTDWYIDQMKRQSYESDPLPIYWERKDYVGETHDVAFLADVTDGQPIDISWAVDSIRSDSKRMQNIRRLYEGRDIIPSLKFIMKVDSADVAKAGLMPKDSSARLNPEMMIDLGGKRYLTKSEMMILEMLKQNKWQRPIYYATTVSSDMYVGLSRFFASEGLTYRIMPYEKGSSVNTDVMYNNMVNKFKWGNAADPNVYLDENVLRMCRTLRYMFARLSATLITEGKNDKALTAMDKCLKVLPIETVGYDFSLAFLGENYYKIGQKEKAQALLEAFAKNAKDNLIWYNGLPDRLYSGILEEIKDDLGTLQTVVEIYRTYNPELAKVYEAELNMYAARWMSYQQQRR
ncbi:MAG: DUF2723 domain-containing protein [Candidatus Azobacteroides sp.]|nr:DUF2723 domain-containing protein [Candidatus Azobacteroides sp.]